MKIEIKKNRKYPPRRFSLPDLSSDRALLSSAAGGDICFLATVVIPSAALFLGLIISPLSGHAYLPLVIFFPPLDGQQPYLTRAFFLLSSHDRLPPMAFDRSFLSAVRRALTPLLQFWPRPGPCSDGARTEVSLPRPPCPSSSPSNTRARPSSLCPAHLHLSRGVPWSSSPIAPSASAAPVSLPHVPRSSPFGCVLLAFASRA
jgi:hypothetical protein